MFYFKAYNIQTNSVNLDQACDKLTCKNLPIQPESYDLAYIPYKGTTFWRKTMQKMYFQDVPREFLSNHYQITEEQSSKLQQFLSGDIMKEAV